MRFRTLVLAGTAALLLSPFCFAVSVSIRPLEPATQLAVGEIVRWIVDVKDAPNKPLWYRFRTHEVGQPWRTIIDYGPSSRFDWTEYNHEGSYEVEVSVREPGASDAVTAVAPFRFLPRATDSPVISRTLNPLVNLYSAPPCPEGSSMSVTVTATDGTLVGTAPSKVCTAGRSMNFYLAGTKQYSSYTVQHSIAAPAGQAVAGPKLTLNVGAVSPFFQYAPLRVLTGSPNRPYGFLMQSDLFTETVATDLAGNLVWYYDGVISTLTRPVGDGRYWALVAPAGGSPETQRIREFDLASVTTAETNAARVNEQLAAKKMRPVTSFHHDAMRLPDGRVLVLSSTQDLISGLDGSGKTPVIGDTILLLDKDLQVVWAWDSFEHLDVRRRATLGETCTPVGAGCPSFDIAPVADDWLHGNSLQLTPDGSILYSSRHQDWILKIDFANGTGSGNVIWKLGAEGDFALTGGTANDWFSHPHDPALLADGKTLIVYDNGNVRRSTNSRANSRGLVYELDEVSHTAKLVLSADLGVYSAAVGAAQKLPGGNFHFSSGFVPGPGGLITRVSETDGSGKIVYESEIGAATYRTFRLPDLYSRQ